MKNVASVGFVLLAVGRMGIAYGSEPPVAHGIVVVATADAADVAWPLAQKLYRDRSILSRSLAESAARVLAGDAPLEGASTMLTDLRTLRDSVHGDDAASRLVLSDLCGRFAAKAVAVVTLSPTETRAFDCASRTFLRVAYLPDEPNGHSWAGAAHALTLTYGNPPLKEDLLRGATKNNGGRPFYKSWWFWGAIGGAAALGGAALIVANTGGPSQMEMQMHIPR